jgi:hypothetical protein
MAEAELLPWEERCRDLYALLAAGRGGVRRALPLWWLVASAWSEASMSLVLGAGWKSS